MNLEQAARAEAARIAERLHVSRQPLDLELLVEVLARAFKSGALYGIERTQHALAITRAASERSGDGILEGVDRAQRAVVATHEAAQRQAAP